MKALVKYGFNPGDVELAEVPEPQITPDTVIVKVNVVGVCGSDLHMWRNVQSWPVTPPVTLGHEMAGVIAEVGRNVSGWKVGDRVVCETAASICGACALCRAGAYNLCPQREGYGATRDGAFADLLLAEPRVLHRIPTEVRDDIAATAEPFAVAYNTVVERASVKAGDLVVVQGAGTIGTLAMMMAKLSGAGTAVMVGTSVDEHRLEKARELGADHTVDISTQDPLDLIRELGDGFGADLVIDATGVSAALEQSLQLVRPAGSIAKVGWGPQPLGFSLDPLVQKGATLYGAFSHTWNTWERVLELFASGRLNPDSVIGGRYPLEAWESAFEHMESGQNIKSVMTLQGA